MILLNHNIKIKDKVYHVQTEKRLNGDIVIAETHIFIDGTIIWTNKEEVGKEGEITKKDFVSSHKKGMFYLRNFSKIREKNKQKEILTTQQYLKTVAESFFSAIPVYQIKILGDFFVSLNKNFIDSFEIFSSITFKRYYSKRSKPAISNFFNNIFKNYLVNTNSFKSLQFQFEKNYVNIGTFPNTPLVYGIAVKGVDMDKQLILNHSLNSFIKMLSEQYGEISENDEKKMVI